MRHATAVGILAVLCVIPCSHLCAQFLLKSGTFTMGSTPVSGPGFRLESTLGVQFDGRANATLFDLASGFQNQAHPPAGPLAAAIAGDDFVTIDEDTAVEIDVLANDVAPAGDSLRIFRLESAANGSAVVAGGKIQYTPRANFFGADSLGYSVSTSAGGTATAQIRITVNPVNDTPVFKSTPSTSAVAGAEYLYTIEVEDVDDTSLQLAAPTLPPWLSVSVNQDGTATLSGTPDETHIGENPVELTISDGELTSEQSFTIDVAASGIAAPQLVAPENESVVAPPAVTLSWNAVPGAASYDLQVDDNADFSSPVEAEGLSQTQAQLTGLSDGATVFWRVRAVGNDGSGPYSAPFQFSTATNVAAENDKRLPTEFSLKPNYPNPFNPTTTIPFELPETTLVQITVYDLFGREVARLVNDTKTAGRHTVVFKADNLPSGTYFYVLQTKGWSDTRQLVLVK